MKIFSFSYEPQLLLPYIDWSYFFHAWGIKNHQLQGDEALRLKQDAISMIASNNDKRISALFRLCDARSSGDNIILDGELLPLLRQQHNRTDAPNLCLADFVSPYKDHIGLFATSAPADFESAYQDDPYSYMLMQTVADRLVEAAASYLHSRVRTQKELWGYSPNEKFTPQELNNEPYDGIRPAVGYPSLPDQSVIFIIDNLLHLNDISITLTSNGAMHPHASVCGLMFAHPAARYFSIGTICDEQISDYARRRGMSVDEVRRFLVRNV